MRTESHELKGMGIEERWTGLYFATVGLAAGFVGSLVKLGSNMIGASLMGLDSFRLLRVYATIKTGSGALVSNSGISLLDAFLMHLVVGSALGAVFMLIMSRKRQFPGFAGFLTDGVVYGLAVWIVNFYFLLSWIQPLLNGSADVVTEIPWWVASTSHALYGLTIALVSFPFRNDIERG